MSGAAYSAREGQLGGGAAIWRRWRVVGDHMEAKRDNSCSYDCAVHHGEPEAVLGGPHAAGLVERKCSLRAGRIKKRTCCLFLFFYWYLLHHSLLRRLINYC